jgi:hypothetical protein
MTKTKMLAKMKDALTKLPDGVREKMQEWLQKNPPKLDEHWLSEAIEENRKRLASKNPRELARAIMEVGISPYAAPIVAPIYAANLLHTKLFNLFVAVDPEAEGLLNQVESNAESEA